jgi:hypothetical protein
MNCYFCYNEAFSTDLGTEYCCPKCPRDVRLYQSSAGELSWMYFSLIHKSYTYTCVVDISQNRFSLWCEGDQLICWNFIPDITPYNITDKLPTLINFS